MRYSVFICDDEPQMRSILAERVKSIEKNLEVSVFEDGHSLQNVLCSEGNRCDILLLDIDMPGVNGLDIAKKLSERKQRPLLVFVTSHDELVYDSFQFHPFGFVRKSRMDTELQKVLYDCEQELGSREQYFCFLAAGAKVKIPVMDILYFECEGNYLKLFAKEEYRFRETMQAVENALEKQGFVRIHKGYLVNQVAVKMLTADEVLLVNGAHLPIGRYYAEAAKKQLMRYML